MATITEDYVSFETAKLLKEKKFNGDINAYYHIWDNGTRVCSVQEFSHSEAPHLYIPAPTHQMAMKWLRNKGIYIQIRRNINTYLYGAIMLKDGSDIYATIPSELETYEEAVEAAIKYSLKNLI